MEHLSAEFLANHLQAFKESGRCPSLSAAWVPCARSLLYQLIVDHDALLEYLGIVRDSSSAAVPPVLDNPSSADLPRPDFEYEAECSRLIEGGMDLASDDLIARLLLDPLAILNLHMAVEHESPESWHEALAANGRDIPRQNGLGVSVAASLKSSTAIHGDLG